MCSRLWRGTADNGVWHLILNPTQDCNFRCWYCYEKYSKGRASRINQVAVSYDGSVYKRTGRDFTSNLKEGILRTDGTVKWLPEKIKKRLSIKTYDHMLCRICKLLPLCWGACCQKQLEASSESEIAAKCQMNIMELPLNDYLFFRMKSRQKHINE